MVVFKYWGFHHKQINYHIVIHIVFLYYHDCDPASVDFDESANIDLNGDGNVNDQGC